MSIYLDNGATTFPKPECVYKEAEEYMRTNGASPGRGTYTKAMDAEQKVYEARRSLCKLLGIKKPGNIVFTLNATEAINLALKGFLHDGDEVLTTNVEHNAVWRPLKKLEQEKNVKLHYINCTSNGDVDLEELKAKLHPKIKLVAITHGSNVLGNILPLKEIIEISHAVNIPVLADTAQTAGVVPINCTELNIDMLAFTGHKGLMGLCGTGGLYINNITLDTLKEGGTGSMAKSPYPPALPPDRYEAGTQNTLGIVSLGAAADFLLNRGVENIATHETSLIKMLIEELSEIPNIEIYGNKDASNHLGLLSFNVAEFSPYKVATLLDERYGIMVRAGLHCAPLAHTLLGTADRGTLRASLSMFTTKEDISALIIAIKEIAQLKEI